MARPQACAAGWWDVMGLANGPAAVAIALGHSRNPEERSYDGVIKPQSPAAVRVGVPEPGDVYRVRKLVGFIVE